MKYQPPTKTILVTGCSSGIGLTTCTFLKAQGYRVFATARHPEDVASLSEKGFEAYQLDLTNSNQIHDVVAQIIETSHEPLYALCNNAGYAQPGALEDLTRDNLREQFETNVFGLQELTNAVIPIMRQQGFGRIIHISSVLGFISLPFRGAYNASKYAVEGLADTLRLELRKTGIYVCLIEPGPIMSQFRENALAAYYAQQEQGSSQHQDAYTRFLANFKKNKAQRIGGEPIAVSKKILQALESKSPKPRYYVTAPTYLFAALKRILPQRTLDLLLGRISDKELE